MIPLLPLILLFSIITPTLSDTPGLLHVPITRRSGSVDNREFARFWDKFKFRKYRPAVSNLVMGGLVLHHVQPSNKDFTHSSFFIPQDDHYYGTISIGKPSQTLNVILDTRSSGLWVMGDICLNCDSITPRFYPSYSKSFKTPGNLKIVTTSTYAYASVTGYIAADTVTMGGFTIKNQTFSLIGKIAANHLQPNPISGIMGLGFGMADGTNGMPFWQALASGGRLAAKEMSFWLARPGNNRYAESRGAFTLGGRNESLFQGTIDFVDMPASPQEYGSLWRLMMTSARVGDKLIPITPGEGLSVIDTGAPMIQGPKKYVSAIWNAVPGSQPIKESPGVWAFPCSTNVIISLSFGGKEWPIDPKDLNVSRVPGGDGSMCAGRITHLGEPSNWIIGTPFLKNVYSVFRMEPPSIGFAQLSAAATLPDSSAQHPAALLG
ncbi:aspartic peptidase domain-containing protein [Infundibulicybe gibba]|nr:aspartic peptidase domain-containing protein [Infundibulicybe gibba]